MDTIFEKYKQVFDQFVSLEAEEWEVFKRKSKIHYYKKGDIVHHAGDIFTQLYFINYGIIRAYIIDPDGNDYTWAILFNDEDSVVNNVFLVDYYSFINQTESKISFEVLEDCQLLSIQYNELQTLYHKYKNGERLGRLIAEFAFSDSHNLIIDRLTKTASTRYKEFIEKTPYLLDKVPQYHIATLLGITPQSLSRIKKEITLGE